MERDEVEKAVKKDRERERESHLACAAAIAKTRKLFCSLHEKICNLA